MDKNVPFAVFEGVQIRHERTVKRLIIAIVIAILLIFASNAAWLYAWCQYDYTSEKSVVTYSQDGKGVNNINNGTQGDVNNGADLHKTNQNKNTP